MKKLFLAALAATATIASAATCPSFNTELSAGSLAFHGCQLSGFYNVTMSSVADSFALHDSTLTHVNTDGLLFNFDASVDAKPMTVSLSNVTFLTASSGFGTFRSLRFVGTAIPKGSSIVVTGGSFVSTIDDDGSGNCPSIFSIAFEANIFSAMAITIENNAISLALTCQPQSGWPYARLLGVYIPTYITNSTLAVTGNTLTATGNNNAIITLVYWFFTLKYPNVPPSLAPCMAANILHNTLTFPPASTSNYQTYLVYYTRMTQYVPTVSLTASFPITVSYNTITNAVPLYYGLMYSYSYNSWPDTIVLSDNTVTNYDDLFVYVSIFDYTHVDISNNTLTSTNGKVKVSVQACTGSGETPSLGVNNNTISGWTNAPYIILSSMCGTPMWSPLSGALSAANNTVSVAANDNHFVNNGTFHLFDFNVVQTSKAPIDICGNTYMGFKPTDAADLQAISLVEFQSNFILSDCPQSPQTPRIVKLS